MARVVGIDHLSVREHQNGQQNHNGEGDRPDLLDRTRAGRGEGPTAIAPPVLKTRRV